MLNFKWLSVFDLKGRFKITENLPEKDFDIAVKDSYDFDVVTSLPDSLMDDIKSVLQINPIQWSASKTYSIGDKVFYDGVYYSAADTNTDSAPTALNTDWEEIQLMTFWTDYVKPYFMCCAYYRFLLWHGTNITQFGARQNNEETSVEITDKKKGELMADISGKKDIFYARLSKKFNDMNQTFDGVTYSYDVYDNQNLTKGVRIWGLGKRKPNRCCDTDKWIEL